jgi:hypothetical protein
MEKLKIITEIISDIVTSSGIVIGGIWAYLRFFRRNEGQWNANMKVKSEIVSSKVNEHLILLTITIDNVGNRKITPTKDGLSINLYKEVTGKSGNYIVDEWQELVEVEKDILSEYKDIHEEYGDYYNLDPGATYTEKIIIRIKNSGLYKIKCQLHIKDNTMANNENFLTENDFIVLQ